MILKKKDHKKTKVRLFLKRRQSRRDSIQKWTRFWHCYHIAVKVVTRLHRFAATIRYIQNVQCVYSDYSLELAAPFDEVFLVVLIVWRFVHVWVCRTPWAFFYTKTLGPRHMTNPLFHHSNYGFCTKIAVRFCSVYFSEHCRGEVQNSFLSLSGGTVTVKKVVVLALSRTHEKVLLKDFRNSA